jgi:hypothetical protein
LSRAVNRDRTTFSAADVAIHADTLRHVEWSNTSTEPGVCVIADVLRVLANGSAEHTYHVLASLSLHALARHQRRAFRPDDADLFTDLRLLVAARTAHTGLPIETNGGSWRGETASVTDSNGSHHDNVLVVRSFAAGLELGPKEHRYATPQIATP